VYRNAKVEESSADRQEVWGRSHCLSSSPGGLGKAEQRTVKTERSSAQPGSPSHASIARRFSCISAAALDRSVNSALSFALQFLFTDGKDTLMNGKI